MNESKKKDNQPYKIVKKSSIITKKINEIENPL